MIHVGQFSYRDTGAGLAWSLEPGAQCIADLRPLPAQGRAGGAPQGAVVFFHPDSTVRGATPLGSRPTSAFSKSILEQALGVSLERDTIQGALWEALTVRADPEGLTGPKPLMPNDIGEVELHCAGEVTRQRLTTDAPEWPVIQANFRRLYRKVVTDERASRVDATLSRKMLSVFMAKLETRDPTLFIPEDMDQSVTPLRPTTTYTDNFNRADASGWGTASGGGGATWNGGTTDWAILSNQGRIQSTSNVGNQLQADLSSSDMYCQFVARTGSGYHGSAARYETGASTAYSYFAGFGISDDRLAKWIATVRTDLTDTANTWNANDTIKTYANGSTIKGYLNASENASVTDTAIAGNTRAGVYTVGGGNLDIDDWIAEDLAVAVTPLFDLLDWMPRYRSQAGRVVVVPSGMSH